MKLLKNVKKNSHGSVQGRGVKGGCVKGVWLKGSGLRQAVVNSELKVLLKQYKQRFTINNKIIKKGGVWGPGRLELTKNYLKLVK